jgi:hypothetical protein
LYSLRHFYAGCHYVGALACSTSLGIWERRFRPFRIITASTLRHGS